LKSVFSLSPRFPFLEVLLSPRFPGLRQERDDLERKKSLARENGDFIQQQMHWNTDRNKEDRKAWIAVRDGKYIIALYRPQQRLQ
jgi:hypothetical protein